MKTLKINPNFRSLINKLLINSNKLSHSFYMVNNKLMIDSRDFTEVDKLLRNNFHKYKVL